MKSNSCMIVCGQKGSTIDQRPVSVNCDLLSAPEDVLGNDGSATKEVTGGLDRNEPKVPEQFSANGRAMQRKKFSQPSPIVPPKGPSTVSFSEPQIHAVLKITSVETVKSALHAMRSLVLHAVYGGGKQTPELFRKALFRGASPARGASTSSEGETESEGYTTNEFTSGAITSDDDRFPDHQQYILPEETTYRVPAMPPFYVQGIVKGLQACKCYIPRASSPTVHRQSP